jgi:hypothetical protein
VRTPALEAWRARGDTAARDTLWRAACEEATAVELVAVGCAITAAQALARARELWPGDDRPARTSAAGEVATRDGWGEKPRRQVWA